MDSPHPTLTKGTALIVLSNDHGEALAAARRIAGTHASVMVAEAQELCHYFGLARLTPQPPSVLIIDSWDLHAGRGPALSAVVKRLICNNEIDIERKHQPSLTVPSPLVIVVAERGGWIANSARKAVGERRVALVDSAIGAQP